MQMQQPKSAKPRDICQRSFAYALRAIKLYKFLQEKRDGSGWVLGKQYLRAATSIGANIEEAQSGETKADFIHKYGIAQKEAKESHYWLRLLAESGVVPAKRLSSGQRWQASGACTNCRPAPSICLAAKGTCSTGHRSR